MNITEKEKVSNFQQKAVSPWYVEHDAISGLIGSDERIDLLEIMDNEANIVYKMLKFLSFQDEIKEDITKYQLTILSKESSLSLIRDYKNRLKNDLNGLIKLIKSMRIDNFDKYINSFEKFELNEDILELNSNLQRLHTEIINILQNYGIKEKIETDEKGYDESNILVYDVGHVTLLMNYDELPQHIKDFIKNFNELAEHKGSKAVIFYDKTDKIYRIDIYLGAAAGHRAIIKVYENTFELIYTDACYSRLLAVKKMCNDYYYKDDEFGVDVKELEPNLGNVTWKQAVLHFKSQNDFLSEMSDIIKVIKWDYVVNPNNKKMIATVENEAELIYEGAFRTDVKCHRSIIHLISEYIRGLIDSR